MRSDGSGGIEVESLRYSLKLAEESTGKRIAELETALHELVAAIEAQPIVPSARLIQAMATAKQQ